jgi:hypothetical protein
VSFELNLSCQEGFGWLPRAIDQPLRIRATAAPQQWATHGRWGQVDGFIGRGLYIRAHGVQFYTMDHTHSLWEPIQMRSLLFYTNYLRGLGYSITECTSDEDGFPMRARATIDVPRLLSLRIITDGPPVPRVPVPPPCINQEHYAIPAADRMCATHGILPQLVAQYETPRDRLFRSVGLNAPILFQLGIRACVVSGADHREEDYDVALSNCNTGEVGWTRRFEGFLDSSGMFVVNGRGEVAYTHRPDSLRDQTASSDRGSLPSILESINVLRALGYTVTVLAVDEGRPITARAELMIARWKVLLACDVDMLPPPVQ